MQRFALTELHPRWIHPRGRYGVGIRMSCPVLHEHCSLIVYFKHPNDGLPEMEQDGALHYHHSGGLMEELSIEEVIHHRTDSIVVIDRGRVYAWRIDDS